jgi:hypothetical protein
MKITDLGESHGVISESFVMAPQQGDVDRGLHAVRPVVQQYPEKRTLQTVPGVVVDRRRVPGIAGQQRDAGIISDPARDITHPAKASR